MRMHLSWSSIHSCSSRPFFSVNPTGLLLHICFSLLNVFHSDTTHGMWWTFLERQWTASSEGPKAISISPQLSIRTVWKIWDTIPQLHKNRLGPSFLCRVKGNEQELVNPTKAGNKQQPGQIKPSRTLLFSLCTNANWTQITAFNINSLIKERLPSEWKKKCSLVAEDRIAERN